jgi:hypothetical protein
MGRQELANRAPVALLTATSALSRLAASGFMEFDLLGSAAFAS